MNELLTPSEMYRADALAVASGIASLQLMESAGKASAEIIKKHFRKCRTAVLCGPGNNGGDGFVIARLLKSARWPVTVYTWGSVSELKGDAAAMASAWQGETELLSDFSTAELVVDCLFGAGLSRDFPQEVAEQVNKAGCPVVAIDVPSGLDGETGQKRGACVQASLTITFFRKKPGHVLFPGRAHCGEVVVANIGIPATALKDLSITLVENAATELPQPTATSHKYSRGAALVYSGSELSTGASRLAAQAAARIGAGAVTLCGTYAALEVHAAHVTSIMLRLCETSEELHSLLADKRISAFCIGPAAGINDKTLEMVFCALGHTAKVVLDADALTAFAPAPDQLFDAIAKSKSSGVVLTPHEGEFARLFPEVAASSISKIEKVRSAAKLSGAVILLKGADTVVAHPDGRATVNTNAPAKLATAGSGDVLAGIITGLLAQGMDTYEAACAAAWLHGDAANRVPRRTIVAEDLIDALSREPVET